MSMPHQLPPADPPKVGGKPLKSTSGEAYAPSSKSATVPVSHTDNQQPLARHLDQTDLARRWRVSTRTLGGWRWRHRGPSFLKIGGRVVYRLEDVEAFEA